MGDPTKVVVEMAGEPAIEPKDYPLIWSHEAQPHLDQTSLIRGVIMPESMIITYGESNSGKTFHVIDRDLCLAAGDLWYDRETEPGFVLYVAAEGGHSVERRVYAYHRERLADRKFVPFAVLPESLDLFRPEADTEPLIDFIKRTEDSLGRKCVKVTADTVARIMAGGNENSPEDMGALVRNADKVRHVIECAFEGVHHSGKDAAKGARGHSSLRAATDTEIEVKNDGGYHIARVTKQRDLPVGEEFAFGLQVIDLGADRYGHRLTTCVPDWHLDHAPGHRAVKLTPQERRALTFIQEVTQREKKLAPSTVQQGAKPPPKTGQFVCPLDVLRRHVKDVGGLSDSDKADSQRRALLRCLQELQAKGFIQIFKDWAWLADRPDKGGQG